MTDKVNPENKIYKGDKSSLKDAIRKPIQWFKQPFGVKSKLGYIEDLMESYGGKADITVVNYPSMARSKVYGLSLQTEIQVLTGIKGQTILEKLKEERKNFNCAPITMKLGCDPEIFIVDKHNKIVPAWTLFGAKTSNVEAPYWDGFQAEWTTTADTCLAYTVDSVQHGLRNIYNSCGKHTFSLNSVIEVDIEDLAKYDNKYVEFGCMPSLNAYNLQGNKDSGKVVPFRFAGGHIHFGVSQFSKDSLLNGVKALDAILGVSCVSLFAAYDNPVRRRFYGLAGEYRLPKHGLEYRTLSNAWLSHPAIMHLTFEMARNALTMGLTYGNPNEWWDVKEEETIRIIQDCDVDAARSVLKNHKDQWLKLMNHRGPFRHDPQNTLFAVVLEGMENYIKRPEDLESNWYLDDYWQEHSEGGKAQLIKVLDKWEKGKKV